MSVVTFAADFSIMEIRAALSKDVINRLDGNYIAYKPIYKYIESELSHNKEMENREEVVDLVLEALGKFGTAVEIHEHEDLVEKSRMVYDDRGVLFSVLIGSMRELRESKELNLQIADALAMVKVPNAITGRDERRVNAYCRAVSSFRQKLLFTCDFYQRALLHKIGEKEFKEFAEEFAKRARLSEMEIKSMRSFRAVDYPLLHH